MGTGDVTIQDADTHYMFYFGTRPSTPYQKVTLPKAVTGKVLFLVGNYTASGWSFFVTPKTGDQVVNMFLAADGYEVAYSRILVAVNNNTWVAVNY